MSNIDIRLKYQNIKYSNKTKEFYTEITSVHFFFASSLVITVLNYIIVPFMYGFKLAESCIAVTDAKTTSA